METETKDPLSTEVLNSHRAEMWQEVATSAIARNATLQDRIKALCADLENRNVAIDRLFAFQREIQLGVIREDFASSALNGLLASCLNLSAEPELAARRAVELADALIAELKKTVPTI